MSKLSSRTSHLASDANDWFMFTLFKTSHVYSNENVNCIFSGNVQINACTQVRYTKSQLDIVGISENCLC